MSRILRCAACARRIKSHHPHIGLIDLETAAELSYHARCQERAASDIAAMAERGKVYILRHYHSSSCPDGDPGFGCRGGCFDTPLELAN
jgi:hypothetical protein